jgi:aminopeptidase N
MQAFMGYFGPASKGRSVVRIVEAPDDLPAEFGEPGDPGGASFPGGALLDHRAFAQGVANEAVLELAEYELARTWFGWRVRPRMEAQILMGRGLGLFSWIVAAETRGQDARRRMAAFLLEHYDQAQRASTDTRLIESPAGYTRAERITTGYKAALFFVALEDLCGRDNLRTAFTHIVRARGGDDVGDEDLRAAAEAASHRDLAEMFRTWLNRPGIPDEFRARYSSPPGTRSGN